MHYHIFVLRLWAESSRLVGDGPTWRFSLEGTGTAGRKGFKDLADLAAYLEAWTQHRPAIASSVHGQTLYPPTSQPIGEELALPMSINNRTAQEFMGSTDQQAVILLPGDGAVVGALGVSITYKTVGAQSRGQWLVLEYTAPPRFAGPPPHWHKITTEMFYVLEGTLTLRVGERTIQVEPGGCAYVPPRTVHAFSNEMEAPARYLLVASPAGLEHYFTELAELVQDEPSWPPKDMSKVLALMVKYDTFPPQALS